MYGINYIFQMITLREKVINFFEILQLVNSKVFFQTQEAFLLENLNSNHYTPVPLHHGSSPTPKVKPGPPICKQDTQLLNDSKFFRPEKL